MQTAAIPVRRSQGDQKSSRKGNTCPYPPLYSCGSVTCLAGNKPNNWICSALEITELMNTNSHTRTATLHPPFGPNIIYTSGHCPCETDPAGLLLSSLLAQLTSPTSVPRSVISINRNGLKLADNCR